MLQDGLENLKNWELKIHEVPGDSQRLTAQIRTTNGEYLGRFDNVQNQDYLAAARIAANAPNMMSALMALVDHLVATNQTMEREVFELDQEVIYKLMGAAHSVLKEYQPKAVENE